MQCPTPTSIRERARRRNVCVAIRPMPSAGCGGCCDRFAMNGIPFRRQAPVGPYVIDFVWLRGKLAVEVDGGQHNEASEIMRDAARTQWLEAQGFEVLRFWNNDVLRNGAGCQEVIALAIEKRRTLSFME